MGTWGYQLEQDDFVHDVMWEFDQHLKQNQNLQQTTELLIETYKEILDDPDEGPLFWIALAGMQWKYGKVHSNVFAQVISDFDRNAGLERWKEIGETGYTRRKNVITNFVEKISVDNPKPKKLPKIVVRKPVYKAGDCLSINLPNGMYGAALVLSADHSDIEYGQNLIALLNYMEKEEPNLSVFEKRDWLMLTHHNYENKPDIGWYTAPGHRSVKSKFYLLGNIPIVPDDPQQSNSLIIWNHLGNQIIYQRDWDQTH
ncbi:MAG: hypothetical protein JEZ00_12420 [Anaerolineaceae bacterium]|nr:hypothetical protein [Anaerolineaceae bacterium]